MRSTVIGTALAALLAWSPGPKARADEREPLFLDDFAYSVALLPEMPRAVHSAIVPLAVYRGVASPELHDVRVYNAAGEQVPHALRVLDAREQPDAVEVALPFFPLYSETEPGEPLDGLSLHVVRDAKGTVIDLRPVDGVPAPDAGAQREVHAYLLDASALTQPVSGLRVELAEPIPDHVWSVSVDGSDDLSHFVPLAGDRALVSLDYAGHQVGRERIDLPRVQWRYLRVRWPGSRLPGPVAAVHAELAGEGEAPPRARVVVPGTARPDEPGVYDFDAGGYVPADHARVVLPQENTLIEAELWSRSARDEQARKLASGVSYRVLHEGQRVESKGFDFPRTTARYYELRVAQKGGGLGRALPSLELAYHPEQLLFVARGQEPFQLAYGHHGASAEAFEPQKLLRAVPGTPDEELPRQDCRLGEPRQRAGPSALQPPAPPPPLKRYALWAVLVAGVGALAAAAVSLSRSLRHG